MSTIETMRREALTSIHGLRLGLDPDGFLVGPKTLRNASIAATSATTGTALLNYGLTTFQLTTSAAKNYTLNAPTAAGIQKELVATSSSTLVTKVTLTGASLSCTAGSSTTTISFNGRGERALLQSLSTSEWVALSLTGTSS